MNYEFLWYIPNTVEAVHRLDIVTGGRRAWTCPQNSPASLRTMTITRTATEAAKANNSKI